MNQETRHPCSGTRPNPDQRRLKEIRILIKTRAANKMGLLCQIPQVVVISAWSRIGPVQDFIDFSEPVRFRPNRAYLFETVL